VPRHTIIAAGRPLLHNRKLGNNTMTIIPFPDEPELASLRRYFEGWQPPSNEEWGARSDKILLPTIRLAWLTIYKTRGEVREIARGMADEGTLNDLLKKLEWTAAHFSPLVELCQAARQRLIENGEGPEDISA
jgi:hypothetical protein